jgi:hypothetical protein
MMKFRFSSFLFFFFFFFFLGGGGGKRGVADKLLQDHNIRASPKGSSLERFPTL